MLRPCGVTPSVARFGKGRRAQTPLSLILNDFFFFHIFLFFGILLYKGCKRPISLKVIDSVAPFQATNANKEEEVPNYVNFQPRYTSFENIQSTAMVPLPIIDEM